MINKITVVEEQSADGEMYGLEITVNDKVFRYKDISSNKNEIEQLKTRLSNENISEKHVNDIIKDFIIGKAYDRLILNGINY